MLVFKIKQSLQIRLTSASPDDAKYKVSSTAARGPKMLDLKDESDNIKKL